MKSVLIEAHYLPSLAYFSVVKNCSKIILEKHEHFVKQSFRNRCYINTSQGPSMLSIPLTEKSGKICVKDVRIDYSQKWLDNHWRTFQTAYGKAAFFEYYASDLQAVLFKKPTFLFDLNVTLLSLCLKWMRWDISIMETGSFELVPVSGEDDYRNIINAKNNKETSLYDSTQAYSQVFGNMFVPNLSIIDLIFCTGPQANEYIGGSRESK